MKVNVTVDCTPEEARTFLGLPDVAPMQEAILNEVQERLIVSMRAMEPEALMKAWLPAQMQGVEHWQKLFWSQFGNAAAKATQTKP